MRKEGTRSVVVIVVASNEERCLVLSLVRALVRVPVERMFDIVEHFSSTSETLMPRYFYPFKT